MQMEKKVTPESLKLSLARATENDIKKLIAIEETVKGNRVYSPMLTEEEWKEEMKSHEIYLIKQQRKVVGNLSYERKSPNHVYISGIVVLPEFQGKGIAREVLTNLLYELRDVSRVDLVTHPQNAALHLYKSLGFVEESLHENFYGDGEPRVILVFER
jgi:ribosomal protein S18 acetylase RimI-like enzyme